MTRQQRRFTRDSIVMTAALTLAGYEILIGEGRPAVLAFLGSLLVSPVLARFDRDARERERRGERDDDDRALT